MREGGLIERVTKESLYGIDFMFKFIYLIVETNISLLVMAIQMSLKSCINVTNEKFEDSNWKRKNSPQFLDLVVKEQVY